MKLFARFSAGVITGGPQSIDPGGWTEVAMPSLAPGTKGKWDFSGSIPTFVAASLTLEDKANAIRSARAAAYPDIGDQLDVLWKHLADTPNGLPVETSTMLAAIQAVKAKYPK